MSQQVETEESIEDDVIRESPPEWDEIEDALGEVEAEASKLDQPGRERANEVLKAAKYGFNFMDDGETYDPISHRDRVEMAAEEADLVAQLEHEAESAMDHVPRLEDFPDKDDREADLRSKLSYIRSLNPVQDLSKLLEAVPAKREEVEQLSQEEIKQYQDRLLDKFDQDAWEARENIRMADDDLVAISGIETAMNLVNSEKNAMAELNRRLGLLNAADHYPSRNLSDVDYEKKEVDYSEESARGMTAYGVGMAAEVVDHYQALQDEASSGSNHDTSLDVPHIEENLRADTDQLSDEAYTEAQKEVVTAAAKYNAERGEPLDAEEFAKIVRETRRQEEGIEFDENTAGFEIKSEEHYAELRTAVQDMLYDEETSIGNGSLRLHKREKLAAGAKHVEESYLETETLER